MTRTITLHNQAAGANRIASYEALTVQRALAVLASAPPHDRWRVIISGPYGKYDTDDGAFADNLDAATAADWVRNLWANLDAPPDDHDLPRNVGDPFSDLNVTIPASKLGLDDTAVIPAAAANAVAQYEAAWRVATLDLLREALRLYEAEPDADINRHRLVCAARLAVS